MAKVYLYTDGSSSGNPGPGGYGLILRSGPHEKEFSEGFRLTTNNRMELLSVIKGLELLKQENCDVEVYSDSKYVVEAVNQKWVFKWEKEGFRKRKNPDLWIRFLKIYRKHRVTFHWIRGHNNHPQNERCDQLAVAAGQRRPLHADEGYEAAES